ncbi:MAG: group III truncated hemoglobin [Xanthobacteraceae bacterium]|nr:group III truncated hemoglobin [Xanthobacteraceae bacterium]
MTTNPLADPAMIDAGLDEALIGCVVQTFYARAREDEVIGPVFRAAVRDWDEHIHNITNFWSSMMLKTSRYDGRPLRPHLRLPLEPMHFDRWLALFEATVTELCTKEVAQAFVVRARRIADSFEMAIGTHHGKLVLPRHSVRTG